MPELTHAVYRKGDSPIDLARLLDESCDQGHIQGTLAMAASRASVLPPFDQPVYIIAEPDPDHAWLPRARLAPAAAPL